MFKKFFLILVLRVSILIKKQQLVGGKKCLLLGKFSVLCFLVTPVLRFALLPYCRRISC